MAIKPGHRFSVTFEEAFPHGVYLTSAVEPARDYEAKGRDDQRRDKASGERVWQARAMDADPEARRGEFTIKFVGSVRPTPPEALAGTPFRPVEFVGLTVTPYVEDKTNRLAYSFTAEGMRAVSASKAGKSASSSGSSSQSAPA